ncbi:MAG: peptidoglycan-associated lipoprotein Pal [Pseudomonadota bacterium]|nr:peptidoglycan-associated lipoprotein Pal [Pseudomonadota bacterium]
MKRLSLALTFLAAATLAACSSTPLAPPTAAAQTAPPTSSAQGPSTAQSSVATVTLDPLDDPKSELAARSVYFAYDDFSIDPKYQPLVQAHGRFLEGHPQVQVRVEGNTDERGSREYNLALGDKRAQIVARQLQVMGAKSGQVEAVSYGAERPKNDGHDESAWAENRRADIRYVKR